MKGCARAAASGIKSRRLVPSPFGEGGLEGGLEGGTKGSGLKGGWGGKGRRLQGEGGLEGAP